MNREDVDLDAALAAAYGDPTAGPAQEARRRGKAERKMTVKPEDGRRKRATGRTVQFNVMMKPDLKKRIATAAHRAGVSVTQWVEMAALAYMSRG
jgi:predicted HicB family RNase H-like nuclease